MTEESKLVKKLNEETKQIKIEQSDLDGIKELRNKYRAQTVKIGQLNIERILMNQAVEKLNESIITEEQNYIKIQTSEKELISQLQEKYGMGSLNLETGTFLPAVKAK